MGNWNWRRRSYHQKASNSPTSWLQPELSVSDMHDNVPSWEKKFCTCVGSVQWWRIVNAKKLIHSYPNIIQWNDSAAEEAFNDAKARFWAEINGSQCDTCLPDSDMYLDNIDWNPNIDPELVSALDLEYVCPEAVSNGTWKPTKQEKDKKQEKDENPWDPSGNIEDNGNTLKIGVPTGWGEWVPKSNQIENPWEQSSNGVKDVKSWGWNKEENRKWGDCAAEYTIPARRIRESGDWKTPWERGMIGHNNEWIKDRDKNWEWSGRKREGSVQKMGWCRNDGFHGDGSVWNSKIPRFSGQERYNNGRF